MQETKQIKLKVYFPVKGSVRTYTYIYTYVIYSAATSLISFSVKCAGNRAQTLKAMNHVNEKTNISKVQSVE